MVAERHLNDPGNFSFATFEEPEIAAMVRAVAQAAPDAITTFCTNLRAAALVAPLEAELGIPVLDTIAVVVWSALRLAGVDPARVQGWGRLFQHPLPDMAASRRTG